MAVAQLTAQQSYARRLKVGCILVKDGCIIGEGYNGTLSGQDNNCEIEVYDAPEKCEYIDASGIPCNLTTKPTVIHAETNLLKKMAKSNHSTVGAVMFITHNPCPACATNFADLGIDEIIYLNEYRDLSGVEILKNYGVKVRKFDDVVEVMSRSYLHKPDRVIEYE